MGFCRLRATVLNGQAPRQCPEVWPFFLVNTMIFVVITVLMLLAETGAIIKQHHDAPQPIPHCKETLITCVPGDNGPDNGSGPQ